jgi:hypothetical protein
MKLDLTDISQSSASFGAAKITLTGGVAQGPNIPCRSCIVKPDSANSQPTYISGANPATSNDFPLSAADLPIPIKNLNQLFFYSAQTDAIVRVLWRL